MLLPELWLDALTTELATWSSLRTRLLLCILATKVLCAVTSILKWPLCMCHQNRCSKPFCFWHILLSNARALVAHCGKDLLTGIQRIQIQVLTGFFHFVLFHQL